MKRTFCAALFSVLLILLFAPAAAAMDTSVDPSVRVYDYAELLTDEEEASLSKTASQISTDQGVDLVVVTIDDAEGLSSMEYADDFFDYNDFSADGVLMLINMDEREVWFSTSGTCIRVFSDRRIESMVQSCLGDLSDGDYSGAVETFFSKAENYLIQGEEPDSGTHYVDNPEDLDYTPETDDPADSPLPSGGGGDLRHFRCGDGRRQPFGQARPGGCSLSGKRLHPDHLAERPVPPLYHDQAPH